MGVALRQLVVHRFRRNMFLAKKGTEDQFALACELELVFGQVVFQGVHLFRIFARRHDQPPTGSSLKTNLRSRSRGEMAVEGRPSGRDLTAFSRAVYSPFSSDPTDVRLVPDAQA